MEAKTEGVGTPSKRTFTRPEDNKTLSPVKAPGGGSPSPSKKSPGGGSGSPSKGRRKPKKWVPPILPRYKKRNSGPGPGSYDLGHAGGASYHKEIKGVAIPRSNPKQDARDFYFGAAMGQSSAMFGRDSPGPVYQTGGSPGKPFPGPRASVATAPGFSTGGEIQRPFLEPTCSPGPKYLYEDTTKSKTTYDFSMASRAAQPPEPERSPGPAYNPNPEMIGNITQQRSGAYSMTMRPHERPKGDEPGPGAFDVGSSFRTDQLDSTKPRLPKHYIGIRFDDRGPDMHRKEDRKGKIRVPKYPTAGPETGNGKGAGLLLENVSKHGGFSQGPGHAAAIDNMSLPGSDKGFTMSLIIP